VFGKDENLIVRAQWPMPLDNSQYRSKALEKYNFRMDTKNAEEFFSLRMPTIEESLKATKKRLAS
jgi:dTDP-4-dehydrorhamnose reductase